MWKECGKNVITILIINHSDRVRLSSAQGQSMEGKKQYTYELVNKCTVKQNTLT